MSTKTTVSSRITTYLNSRKTRATTIQINKAVGGNTGTIAARLSDLVKAGTVDRVRDTTRKTTTFSVL